MNGRAVVFFAACLTLGLLAAGINPFEPGDPYRPHVLQGR